MPLNKLISMIALITLMTSIAIYGCSSQHLVNQDEQQLIVKEKTVDTTNHQEVGNASWYGPGLQGHETSNGEKFDQNALTAAHPNLPMGTKAQVTNLANGKTVDVTINDRGPDVKGRVIDLSKGAAKKLDMKKTGTARVKIKTMRNKN
ncbi:septal ring lytic transglycosylase RlpA family protein [Methylomonas sp. AM2-LC]|uniref:septal ring lytic transglycosylase RlpA family protein n=1 Tax=Methylomonas sp. AM2-LC TaxID=3153301 RepID=UPI003263D718